MASVYVLRSLKAGKKYVGSTSLDPLERLRDHNSGRVPWTSHHKPLKLIYTENFETIGLAQKRERFFKTGKGRAVLNSLLKEGGRGFPPSPRLRRARLPAVGHRRDRMWVPSPAFFSRNTHPICILIYS